MNIENLKVFENANGEVVITSLIIAEETNQRHADVMRDMRKWVGDLKSQTYKDSQGKEQSYYELDKYQFMLYAMHKKGYDEWKQQIVDEYKTMEQYIIQTNQTKEYYQWVDKRIIEAHETYEFYNLINDKGKCIALSKCLYNIVSYRCNFDFIHNKEQVFQLSLNTDNKKPWLLYQEIKENAETYVKYWMKKNSDNFMHNVIDDLLDEYIEDKKEFESYCKSHKKDTLIIERNTNRGFGILKPLIVE